MEEIVKTESYLHLRLAILTPFLFETQEKYQDAIKDHQEAVKKLQVFLDTNKKIGKFYRVMFKRQREVHLERIQYLQAIEKTGNWDGVIVSPTILSATRELQSRCLALDHQEIYQASKDKGVTDTAPASLGKENLPNSSIPFFTPTLNASAPPKVYRISHDSELIMLGQRAHWMFVKDESNMHLLYAMHVLWQDDVPITAGLLRRASELLPACGAVYTKILRTPGGAYRLQMETTSQVLTTETPDRGQFTKVWSPRRFTYGGRNFVWEAQKDGGPWSKFEWETLYETQSVSKKEGSKTGKMEDVKVGQKLCWGEKTGTKIGGKRVEHTIYISAGLDQIFTEHLLASQLSRYVKTQYPASKDPGGVENAITAGSGLFAFAIAVSGVV